jgi:hypothetical protein
VLRLGAGLAAFVAPAIEQRQLAPEALDHALGCVSLLAGLVVSPFPGAQRALDVDLAALTQIPLSHFRNPLVEHDDAVELRALSAIILAPSAWRSNPVAAKVMCLTETTSRTPRGENYEDGVEVRYLDQRLLNEVTPPAS